MDCPYREKCWRHSYSRYLLEVGYTDPPERLVLVLDGYAQMEMINNAAGKRLYAQYMPCVSSDGEALNLCPAETGRSLEDCSEYRKEARRLAALEAGRRNRTQQGNARVWIPREIRVQVFQRDRYKCRWCGVAVNSVVNGKRVKFVIDHIIPLSRGGHPTDISNLCVACYKCNDRKRVEIWTAGQAIESIEP